VPNYPSLEQAEREKYRDRIVEIANGLPGGDKLDAGRVDEYLEAMTEGSTLAAFNGTEKIILRETTKQAKLTFKPVKASRSSKAPPEAQVPLQPAPAEPESPVEAPLPEVEPTPSVAPEAVHAPMPAEPEEPDAPGDRDEEQPTGPEPPPFTPTPLPPSMIPLLPKVTATAAPSPRVKTEEEWNEGSPGDGEATSAPEPEPPIPTTGLIGPADFTVRPMHEWGGIVHEAEAGNGKEDPDGENLLAMTDEQIIRVALKWSHQERRDVRDRAERVIKSGERIYEMMDAADLVVSMQSIRKGVSQ
jgi:hypothetical protein